VSFSTASAPTSPFSTASAPASPFSSHLQQPFGAHPTPFGAVRDDAVLARANSDQSLAKVHSAQSMLTASSFAEPEHSELSMQHARSKSVRFVGAEHPAILMGKFGVLGAKAGPELGAIKHCPLPTARSLQQGLEADKLASHHPQLKVRLGIRAVLHAWLQGGVTCLLNPCCAASAMGPAAQFWSPLQSRPSPGQAVCRLPLGIGGVAWTQHCSSVPARWWLQVFPQRLRGTNYQHATRGVTSASCACIVPSWQIRRLRVLALKC
jgi:hypothetical protein